MRKKFIAVVLAAALACNMTGMTAAAQPAVAGLSVLKGLLGQNEGGGNTGTQNTSGTGTAESQAGAGQETSSARNTVTLDIGKGDIIIGKSGITAVDTAGNPVTTTSSEYVITGSTEEHAIVVDEGVNANIVLSNVSIVRTMDRVSPLRIADNSSGLVRVRLEGSNTLQGGNNAAGIQKNCMHAGSYCKCGTLEITSVGTDGSYGTLNATGTNGAAGIGGGSGMGSSRIDIKGGIINTDGGIGGASGGIGKNIEIKGGLVNVGSLNGTDGGIVLNGNAVLIADSIEGLDIKKGIVYQNGEGTVYGKVELPQELANSLPADGTLNIPTGARLTVDESVTLPNADQIVGSDNLVVKKAPTATPTAAPEETAQAQAKAKAQTKAKAKSGTDVAVASAVEEEVQSEAQAGFEIQGGHTTITLDVKNTQGQSIASQAVQYGSTVTLEAKVYFNPGPTASVNSDGNNQVQFYLDNSPIGGGQNVDASGTVEMPLPVLERSGMTVKNDPYSFTAKFSGNMEYGESTTINSVNITVEKGDLSVNKSDWIPENVLVGRSLEKAIELEELTRIPTNASNEAVDGKWEWSDPNQKNDIIYPYTSGDDVFYECKFKPTNTNDEKNYNLPGTIKVRPQTVAPFASTSTNDLLKITCVKAKEHETRHKDNGWYNIECGEIKASLQGYDLLVSDSVPEPGTPPVVSLNGWKNANWSSAPISIKVDDNFYNGNYILYARRQASSGEQDINKVVINEFKVDQEYPVIDESKGFSYDASGEDANLTFVASNELSESGVEKYICDMRQRRTSSGTFSKEFTLDEVLGSKHEAIPSQGTAKGEIYFGTLTSNTEYDVYVIVRDNAGNESHYMHRIIGSDGEYIDDKRQEGAVVPGNSQERYGYELKTDNPNLKGDVILTVIDASTGDEKKGTVAYLDTIVADVDFTNGSSDVGKLEYRWIRRQPPNYSADESILNPGDPSTYKVQEGDIDCMLYCYVYGENTSKLVPIIGRIGPVQLGACPEEYAPENGIVDDKNDTFSFTGLYQDAKGNEIIYEYSKDGGTTWEDVKNENPKGSNNFTFKVGDITIPVGQLRVRAKEAKPYTHSKELLNDKPFISTGELHIEFEGELRYGEVLTAKIESDAIDPADISYEWSRVEDGSKIDNYGNTYELTKDDFNKHIRVKAILQDYEDINNEEVTPKAVGKRKTNAVINVASKEYDGTTDAEATVSFTGLINDDNLSSSADVEFADKNAGENKAMKVGKKGSVTGDVAYYDVTWPDNSDVKGTIRPKQLTLNMTAQDKVYDGTTNADVSFTTTAIPGDSISISGNGEFSDKNVGTKKTVTSKDVTVIGTDAANYTAAGSTATATANITQKDISIEGITVADKTYDGTTDATIAVTFTGAADEVNYTYKAAYESPTVGMDKRVTAVITLAGDSAKNYKLANGNATGSGNIVKALAPYEEANIPQGLTGVEGKKLSSVFIGIGFSWKEPNTVMEKVGKYTYDALYNPDPSQYGDREVRVEVLVQCAKHTWGDWTTSVQPTKTETGERRRICAVCGYVEVETVPRAPYIANEDTKEGWGDIMQAINNASSGTEIPILMNGTETLPASVQAVLQGRDVSLVMQMADGITWTLRGQDITGSVLKDINMAVSLYTDNIPTDVLDPYTEGGKTAIQIHLAYSGEFGFTATLRVPLGNEFAGLNSTFYYYNPSRERLEQMDSNRITSDGIGRYDLTHASDYVTIIDTATRVNGGSASENTPTPAPGGNSGDNGNNNNNDNNNGNASASTNNTTGGSGAAGQTNSGTNTGTNSGTNTSANAAGTTSGNARVLSINAVKTGDETPVIGYMTLLLCGAAGVVAIGAYRHGRRKERGR